MRLLLLIVALGLSAVPAVASQGGAPPLTLLGPICHAGEPHPIAGPHRLVMLAGMGNDRMAADTRSPEAQAWFDYGLTLARSFEHGDAILAFQKAEAIDPTCSLCVWGEAFARGSTINYGISAGERAADLALAKKALALAAPGAPPRIRELENALVARYPADGEAGDRAWADAMDAMHRADPGDVETAVFDAEAWLIVEGDGDASGALHAVAVLQPMIAAHADSSGLVHFYIHATENAGEPQLAEPYAARLAELAPNASHMVHMPSHTYYRVGRYEDAALANVAALDVDAAYAQRTDFPTPLGRLMYHFHDIRFGLAGAMMSGDGPVALGLVTRFDQDFPDPASYDERVVMAAGDTYAALGRYAAPAAVLAAPDSVAANPFLEAMRHYARGEADLRLGRLDDLRAEAALVRMSGDDAPNPADGNAVVTRIARLSLEGDADMLAGDAAAATKRFAEAAQLQDARLAKNIDPPRWWFPVRRDLAAALLAAGDAAGAAREAAAVLRVWRLDPVTMAIQARAERTLGAPAWAHDQAAARHAWRGDARGLAALS